MSDERAPLPRVRRDALVNTIGLLLRCPKSREGEPQMNEVHMVGALPPYSVTYIDPAVCATSTDQWFVMGTVDGSPRNQQGPVAICEYEPTAHTLAALLNASVKPGQYVVQVRRPSPFVRLWNGLRRR